jgi:hypothetical protein
MAISKMDNITELMPSQQIIHEIFHKIQKITILPDEIVPIYHQFVEIREDDTFWEVSAREAISIVADDFFYPVLPSNYLRVG